MTSLSAVGGIGYPSNNSNPLAHTPVESHVSKTAKRGAPGFTILLMKKSTIRPHDLTGLGREAKALVAMAFRNGPIENVHAGKDCPTCCGKDEYSHITQAEMREIMKTAVDRLYTFLVLKQSDHAAYEALVSFGERYTTAWDDPTLTRDI